jgi:hypothetical protein
LGVVSLQNLERMQRCAMSRTYVHRNVDRELLQGINNLVGMLGICG